MYGNLGKHFLGGYGKSIPAGFTKGGKDF